MRKHTVFDAIQLYVLILLENNMMLPLTYFI